MKVSGLTHKGCRANNEDSYIIAEFNGVRLLVVADGLGGCEAGEVASDMAVRVIKETAGDLVGTMDEVDILDEAMRKANIEIGLSQKALEYECMSTTAVAALINRNKVAIGNVGDSRVYLIDDAGLKRITKDQSIVQFMLDRKKLDEEEAFRHPLRNMVTQVLGSRKSVTPDFYELELKEGDILLLCSDGLSDAIRDNIIEGIVKRSDDLGLVARELVNAALDGGGKDNITVVLCGYAN